MKTMRCVPDSVCVCVCVSVCEEMRFPALDIIQTVDCMLQLCISMEERNTREEKLMSVICVCIVSLPFICTVVAIRPVPQPSRPAIPALIPGGADLGAGAFGDDDDDDDDDDEEEEDDSKIDSFEEEEDSDDDDDDDDDGLGTAALIGGDIADDDDDEYVGGGKRARTEE